MIADVTRGAVVRWYHIDPTTGALEVQADFPGFGSGGVMIPESVWRGNPETLRAYVRSRLRLVLIELIVEKWLK